MAFLIDRGIAAESEEEFDAEIDRYEELKDRLLGGQTMEYEEMEELLAAANGRNDREVTDALKNVVDGPADVLPEEDEFQEKEERLPDRVVNEAVETLRRMY